ncbi:unnamed protein product [Peniophora sp. CBMAI 1063]|nr:unnamed protein product [Peniophora sp. CBMAI 1063]
MPIPEAPATLRNRHPVRHPTTRPSSAIPSPSATQGPTPRHESDTGLRGHSKALRAYSRRKPLPPIPGSSPSSPDCTERVTLEVTTPLPPPVEQLPVETNSAHLREPQLAAAGFSPAQVLHVMGSSVQRTSSSLRAPAADPNIGPPPGLTKRPAVRQDGLPYALLPAERRHSSPSGMHPPPLGTTCVRMPGTGSDGKPMAIEFDFLGLLSPERQILGAFARPESSDLAYFPRMVAVKMIRKAELAANNEMYLWLTVEVETMKKLAGENYIASALAVFQDADFIYVVSRWYAGDLADYMTSWTDRTITSFPPSSVQGMRVMAPDVFRFYAGELLLAMGTMRDLNIVHADVKPANIFVSPNGHLALADFDRSFVDVSRARQEQGCAYEDVSLDILAGTPRYMAPEVLQHLMWQADGPAPREIVTPRADLWSLGLTLLEFALCAALRDEYTPGEFHEGFFEATMSKNGEASGPRDLSLEERLARVLDPIFLRRCEEFFHSDVYAFFHKLLSTDPRARGTIDELMKHSLFTGMDWNSLRTGTSTPMLVEVGACPRQERAAIGPLNMLPASLFRPFLSGGHNRSHLFPKGMVFTLSYDQFSDWIAPCGPSEADDLHGLVVPVQQLPLQPQLPVLAPHMGR